MRKLHWDATPGLADVENTIWGTVEEGAHMEFDMKDFEDTFSTSRKAAKAKPKASSHKPTVVRLAEAKRAQQIEIGLSRFGLSSAAIRAAIEKSDTTNMTGEMLERIGDFAPDKQELRKIKV